MRWSGKGRQVAPGGLPPPMRWTSVIGGPFDSPWTTDVLLTVSAALKGSEETLVVAQKKRKSVPRFISTALFTGTP